MGWLVISFMDFKNFCMFFSRNVLFSSFSIFWQGGLRYISQSTENSYSSHRFPISLGNLASLLLCNSKALSLVILPIALLSLFKRLSLSYSIVSLDFKLNNEDGSLFSLLPDAVKTSSLSNLPIALGREVNKLESNLSFQRMFKLHILSGNSLMLLFLRSTLLRNWLLANI